MVPCFPLLGLTPSGLFMGLSSAIIYTSELILSSTINLLFDKFLSKLVTENKQNLDSTSICLALFRPFISSFTNDGHTPSFKFR